MRLLFLGLLGKGWEKMCLSTHPLGGDRGGGDQGVEIGEKKTVRHKSITEQCRNS